MSSRADRVICRGEARAVNKVQLAVSQLGGIPGATAYHSSVLVNDEEFSFSDAGISIAQGPSSHRQNKSPPRLIDLGKSAKSGRDLQAAVGKHFAAGTYDLLRKNCNSFSDCAIFFLLNQRLDQQYRTLERLGGRQPALVQAVSGGKYTPNPRAADFDLERAIADMDPDKVWKTPGHATGGARTNSAEGMRNARLARFSGRVAEPGCGAPQHPPAQASASAVASSIAPSAPSASSPARPQAAVVADDERLARQLQEEDPESWPAAAAATTAPAAGAVALGRPTTPDAAEPSPPSSLEADERFARQLLAEEEDERLARQLMAEEEEEATGAALRGTHGGGSRWGSQQQAPNGDPFQQILNGFADFTANMFNNRQRPTVQQPGLAGLSNLFGVRAGQ